MPIAFLDLLLEDKIQLSVHHTVPESDQSNQSYPLIIMLLLHEPL